MPCATRPKLLRADLQDGEDGVRMVQLELEAPRQVDRQRDAHGLPGRQRLLDVVAVEVHVLARVRPTTSTTFSPLRAWAA